MSGTAARMRAWRGPAAFSYGFRPFFLGAGMWAALAMALWLPMLSGWLDLPTAFDPVSWHAHEFLFGYLGAVIAGFLLTAVPNWTGRAPVVGWPLAALFALWLAGRIAVAASAHLPPAATAAIDLALPLALGAAIAREIVAGRNWRNLIVLAMLAAFAFGDALFHREAASGGYAAGGAGLRLGLAAAVMMIAVIGGRIVPSFTRNWLVRQGDGRLPAPPMQGFDKLSLLALLGALALWVAAPGTTPAGAALLLAGGLHLVRLGRWAGERTLPEPLLLVLHVGYAMLPLGALALGASIFAPDLIGAAAAQHIWMAGGVGLMTLAVMIRATLGHTGRALTAGSGARATFLALLGATAARLAAGALPGQAPLLHAAAALLWIAAFGGFVALYSPLLLRPKA